MLEAVDAKGWHFVPCDSKEASLLKLTRIVGPEESIALFKLGCDPLKKCDKVLGLLGDDRLTKIDKDGNKGHASRLRELERGRGQLIDRLGRLDCHPPGVAIGLSVSQIKLVNRAIVPLEHHDAHAYVKEEISVRLFHF